MDTGTRSKRGQPGHVRFEVGSQTKLLTPDRLHPPGAFEVNVFRANDLVYLHGGTWPHRTHLVQS